MGSIITKSKSVLRMKKVFVSNMYFERKEEADFEKADTAVERSIRKLEDGSYKVLLTMRMEDKQEAIKLGVTVCGIFELEEEADESIRKAVISKNTVAILFPYLRSQITLLTSQPDIRPVVLPAININSLLDNLSEGTGLN